MTSNPSTVITHGLDLIFEGFSQTKSRKWIPGNILQPYRRLIRLAHLSSGLCGLHANFPWPLRLFPPEVCKQSRAGGAFGPKNSRQVPTAAMAAVAAHKWPEMESVSETGGGL